MFWWRLRGAAGSLALCVLVLGAWARADLDDSSEDLPAQNGPSAEKVEGQEHAAKTSNRGKIINIDTEEELYYMMGKDMPDGAASEFESRRAKGSDDSAASATADSSVPGGDSVEEEQATGDGNMVADLSVDAMGNENPAPTLMMEDISEISITMEEIPSDTAGVLPESDDVDDTPTDPVYIASLPTYTDVEDVNSYDVDEHEIPTVSPGKENVTAEDVRERGSIPESDYLGSPEGDGDSLSVEEMYSLPGSLDVDEELSKMNIKKGDLLSSMNTDKLNGLLRFWMNWLKRELEAMYRSELKRSDMLWDNITGAGVEEQGYGGTPRSVAALYGGRPVYGQKPGPFQEQGPVTPQASQEFWQPYIFDTGVGNRKDIKIEGVAVQGSLQGANVAEIIHVNLPAMSVLYVSHDGFGYMEVNGKLERLVVLNKWTLSSSGCQCGAGVASQECACCAPGGCLCQGTPNTCVACGTEYSSCQGLSGVYVSVAAGSVISSQDGSLHLSVLAVAQGSSINFFSHSSSGASLQWLGSMTLQQEVTHLAFGTTFTDHDEATVENTFLVIFSSGATDQQFNEIIVSSMAPTFTVGPPVKWQAKGQAMRAHQGDGYVFVSVHGHNSIDIFTLQEDMWMTHHMIPKHTFKGAFHSWLVFHINFEMYVALAARRHIVFYRWNRMEAEFEQFNTIYMGDAMSSIEGLVAVNVESCQEEVSVVVAGHGKHVAVIALQYNFTTSTHAFVMEFTGSLQATLDWSVATHHLTGTSTLVTLEAGRRQVVLVRVEATATDLEHPMGSQRDVQEGAMDYIKNEHARQQAIIAALESRLAKSVLFSNTISADVTVTGGITISGALSTGRLSAVRLVFPNTELQHGVTHLQYLQHINTARPGLDLSQSLLQDIQAIENTLLFAVPVSGPNRTIEGSKTVVVNRLLSITSLDVQHLSVTRVLDLNGDPFPLNETLAMIVTEDQTDRIVRGRKTFSSRLSVQHLHTPFLDDIPTSDLVTLSGRHSIAGAVFARGLWAQEVEVRAGGTLGGVDLSRMVLLGQAAVLGKVTFASHEFVARSVHVVSGVVGGVDLGRLYNHSLLVTGGQFAGSLLFTSDLSVHDLVAGVMMGVDVARLAESTVFRDEDAVLTGKLHFTQMVTVEGHMTTNSINGRQFPGDYAVKTGSSPIVFSNDVSFRHVAFGEVSFGPQGVVDGIAPHRLVTRTTDQTVTGTKVFSAGIDIRGHLDITTKILDNVNLDDLFSGNRGQSSLPADMRFDLVFKGDVQMQRIFTRGTVNGVDLSALANDLVYRDEEQVRITGRKVFLKGLTLTNARFQGGFNGMDLNSLVTTDSEVVINGVFTFASDVFFRSLVVRHVNGIDLNALINSALHLNKAGQVVRGRKVFLKKVVVDSLVIEGTIRGVDFSKFVTKSGNQTFTAPQVFNTANFAFLRAHNIHMSQGLKINGVDLSELARRRVALREPVSHMATLRIEGPLELGSSASIGILNGANLEELLNTIVTDEGDHIIDGQVSLSSLRVLGSVTTQGSVGGSGISLRSVAQNGIKLSANNQITGQLSFSQVEVRGDVAVGGLVQGVNLQRLHQDAVYTDVQTLQTITGPKMFNAGFTVRGSIHAGTVGGVDLAQRLLTRTTDQVITGAVTFRRVAALKNIFLHGRFNNFDVKALAQETMMRGRNEEIVTEDITFTGRVTVRNLVLHGVLQGPQGSVDVVARLADAVRLQDTAITITSKKVFTAGLSFANLHVEILDGRKLDHFLALVVTRNRPHTLTGAVRVGGTITAPWVTAQQLAVQGTIDGVDLQALRQAAVFLSGHQAVDASLVFRESVLVRGNLRTVFLNDLVLSEGYLTTSTHQTFNFNVTLSSALASHVEVRGLVNSWNLPREWNRTLLALGGQSMPGSLTLSGHVVVKGDLIVTGRVGRGQMVKLSRQVVLLDRRTQVSGSLSFTIPLTVAWLKSSTSVVNGVDLTQMYRNAWFVDTTTQLSTSVTFFGRVLVKRAFFTQSTIDGLDVLGAYNIAKAARDGLTNITVEFESEFERICHPIARLYNKLESCMFEPDHLAVHGSLPLSAVPLESISFFAFGTTALLVSYEDACHLDFLTWQGGNFVLRHRLQNVGLGRHFHMLQHDERRVLVAMAASPFNTTCSQTNSTIFQVTVSGIEVYQVLGESMYITEDGHAGSSMLLHGLHHTLAYTVDINTRRWSLVATLPAHAGGVLVHPVYGVIHLLRDYTNATTYVQRAIPAVSRGGIRLVFALFSTITSCQGPAHYLKVFREVDGTHHCVAEAPLPTLPADLTVFFAGSKAAGSHLAVVTMHYNQFPIIFSFAGEVLSRWGEVEVATTATWVEHALVRRPGRHFPDYYILLSPLQHIPEPTTTTTNTIVFPTDPYSSTNGSYDPYSTTSGPYDPYSSSFDPYNPFSSTSGPYKHYSTSGPYDPYSSTSDFYNPYSSTSGPYDPYDPYSSTSGPYDPYSSTSGPYDPYSSTSGPYDPYSSTSGPYDPYSSTSGPYDPYSSTSGPYDPYSSTSGPYDPYSSTSGPYDPYSSTSGPYDPYSSTSGPYDPYSSTSGPYDPYSSTSGPYDPYSSTSGPYDPYSSTSGPYDPYSSTSGPYDPYSSTSGPYDPYSSTSGPYDPYSSTSGPYDPYSSTSDPYKPYSSTSDPYKPYSSTSDPYKPYSSTSDPYKPYSSTSDPYKPYSDPYKPYSSTSDPYKPYSSTSDPYKPYSSTSDPYKPYSSTSDPYKPYSSTSDPTNLTPPLPTLTNLTPPLPTLTNLTPPLPTLTNLTPPLPTLTIPSPPVSPLQITIPTLLPIRTPLPIPTAPRLVFTTHTNLPPPLIPMNSSLPLPIASVVPSSQTPPLLTCLLSIAWS
ncbi:uncharacterized protein LOC123512112 isoform X3 [Portunus trituberculatus]|uniref:uncharacterized protein LOC123512112 isoform X3 n=1 Tax=Portunus trituberculatus TaxID=210409 RepID=UPI001E1CE40E|nr:uncharacterized protein LOC123512112 isoform X3 [Portunus trituberculatus]